MDIQRVGCPVQEHQFHRYRLNRKGIPSSQGVKWHIAAVRDMLKRRAYVGDFEYNVKKSGKFFVVNGQKEVVAVEEVFQQNEDRVPSRKIYDDSVFVVPGDFLKKGIKPIIPPKLFAKAQERFNTFSTRDGRKPRATRAALSGVLFCKHCGSPMYPAVIIRKKSTYRVYRCSGISQGKVCKRYEIREDFLFTVPMGRIATARAESCRF